MNDYSDQATWFEVWGYDGVRWEFVADTDTREGAVALADVEGITDVYEQTRIKRVRGLA